MCTSLKEPQTWICFNCGSRNPVTIVLCNSCGTEQRTFTSKRDWSCPQCKYTNFPNTNKCSNCGKNRLTTVSNNTPGWSAKIKDNNIHLEVDAARLTDKDIQDKLLKCEKCQTLLYNTTGSCCTVCDTPCLSEGFKPRPFPQSSLPKAVNSDAKESQVWECSHCFLLNDSSEVKCKACASNKTINGESALATGHASLSKQGM